ncbi:hypothetical protein MMC27_007157 [Xylographa pallens]|nr:hypothetical protein [Xylographa pallens]
MANRGKVVNAHVRKTAKKFVQITTRLIKNIAFLCMFVVFTPAVYVIASWNRASAAKNKHRTRNKVVRVPKKDITYAYEDVDDFWGAHVEQRQNEYRIPAHNKKARLKKTRSAIRSRTFGLA